MELIISIHLVGLLKLVLSIIQYTNEDVVKMSQNVCLNIISSFRTTYVLIFLKLFEMDQSCGINV